MDENENLYVVIVRRKTPISGAALQPVYYTGPYTELQITDLENGLSDSRYYVDEVVPLLSLDELHELIA